MKKLILPLVCLAALCSCSNTDANSDSKKTSETTSAIEKTESTSSIEKTETTINSEAETSSSESEIIAESSSESSDVASVNANDIYFDVNENGINVMIQNNENPIQVISGDFASNIISYSEEVSITPADLLVSSDFDFDGYNDLFIPTTFGTTNLPGIYYKYNSDKNIFEEWNELSNIGFLMTCQPTNNTLVLNVSGSAVDNEQTAYKWNSGKIVPFTYRVQYAGDDGQIYIDDYTYNDNGEKVLDKTYLNGEEPAFNN